MAAETRLVSYFLRHKTAAAAIIIKAPNTLPITVPAIAPLESPLLGIEDGVKVALVLGYPLVSFPKVLFTELPMSWQKFQAHWV